MLIPKERGRTVRLILAGSFVALGLFLLGYVIMGIHEGRMLAKYSQYSDGAYVSKAENPQSFWTATAFNTALAVWILYVSIAEIRFTQKYYAKLDG